MEVREREELQVFSWSSCEDCDAFYEDEEIRGGNPLQGRRTEELIDLLSGRCPQDIQGEMSY